MSRSPRQAEELLGRLEWTVLRKLDGLMQGNYRTLFRGFGLDFADLREYQAHDDVRHIDWNVTARTSIPHVRVYNEDREVTAWLLLDLSPSVDFGSGEVTKRQVLVELAAVLARLLTRQGNRVGAILFNGVSDLALPARTGRRHVLHLIDTVISHPRLLRSPGADLGAFLARSQAAIKRRSLIFAISDFIAPPGWERALLQLGRRHEVLAMRLTDPLERSLPELGLLTFQDSETGERLVVDTLDERFRRRFAAVADANEERLMQAFMAAGTDVLEVSTGDDLVEAMLRFAGMRKTEARVGGGRVAAG